MLGTLNAELLVDGHYGMCCVRAQSSTQRHSDFGGHVKPIHTCQRFADLVCSCSYFEKNPTAGYCRAVVSGKVRKAQEKFPTLMIR